MNSKLLLLTSVSMAVTGSLKGVLPIKPNIIVILTDDMGYSDVGCYGGKIVPTPNIDRLAQEGIMFTRYYSASPISSPSRTGLLTGMYPARWNINSYLQTKAGNRECEMHDYLDATAPTIAKALKSAGYATGHFGKWHMGGGRDVDDAPGIKEYGFDEYSSTWESPDPDPLLTSTDWIWAGSDSIKRWERTGYFVDKTLSFLERHKGQPCFINLWPDDVHTPWVPGQERFGLFPKGTQEEQDLRGVMAEYDRQIGRLMEGLKKIGIKENTIVIFTSDNGPLPSFRGSRSGNMRGSKLSLYEGGIRLPFIVSWPATGVKGKVDETSVISAVDLLPTFCALAGTALPKGISFDGKDRSRIIAGKTSREKRLLYWEYGRNETSFAYPKGADRSPSLAVMEGDWKLLMKADGTGTELYDLSADKNETTNVADKFPKITERLKSMLAEWKKSLPEY